MKNVIVRNGKENEYEEYMKLIDKSFDFNSGGFLGILPKLYEPQFEPAQQNSIVFENERPCATVGMYMQNVKCLNRQLKIAGIGNVAVLPEDRKKGYMKLAMSHAIERMKNEKADFAFLGGQRQRYNYFGFDMGGYCYFYSVGTTNLRHSYGEIDNSEFTFLPLDKNDTEALQNIALLNKMQKNRIVREDNKLFRILSSWADFPYIVKYQNSFIGYFIINDSYNFIPEFGLTDMRYFKNFVAGMCALCKGSELEISVPAYENEYNGEFSRIAENMKINNSAQYCILNYKSVLEAYLNLAITHKKLSEGRAVFFIHGINGDENIEVSVQGQTVAVREVTAPPDIELTHLEAMRFFMGLYNEKRSLFRSFCDNWFPLPVYFCNADHV